MDKIIARMFEELCFRVRRTMIQARISYLSHVI